MEVAADAGPDKRSYRVSFEKIRRKLPAFKPRWDARMGAEQLYKAYRSSGLTLEEFEGPRYQRIAHIKKLLADEVLDANLRHTRPLRNEGASFAIVGEALNTMALGQRDQHGSSKRFWGTTGHSVCWRRNLCVCRQNIS